MKWWIESVVVQISKDHLSNFNPFLCLSYVADELELRDVASRLRHMVDAMMPGEVRLDSMEAAELKKQAGKQKTSSLKRALELLDREYLVS